MIDITQEEIMKNWNVDNTDNPLVSIRCITYNHELYIAQALDGFLMQKTSFPFEVIVHDDASTDKTADIIREYEAKFPKIIKPIYETENQYSKHDGSLSRIMNAACKGKYIAFCEGDDYWINENKLQLQVDFLENNPDYGMCYTSFNILHQNSGVLEENLFNTKPEKYQSEYTLEEWIYKAGYIAPMSWLFKKELYDKKPEIKTLDGSFVMVACFIHESKVKCFRKNVTCVYRILDESAAHSRDIKKVYERNKSLIDTKIALIDLYELSEELANKCLQQYYHSNFKMIASCESYVCLEQTVSFIEKKLFVEKIILKLSKIWLFHLLISKAYSIYWKYVGYKKNS